MSLALISDRLRISSLEISDLEDVHRLHLLPETDQYNTLGIPFTLEQTEPVVSSWASDNEHPGGPMPIILPLSRPKNKPPGN